MAFLRVLYTTIWQFTFKMIDDLLISRVKIENKTHLIQTVKQIISYLQNIYSWQEQFYIECQQISMSAWSNIM